MQELISLQAIFNALLVAFPTAFLSVFLALKKYRTEKWWDRKADCYITTIDALNNIIRYCDSVLAEELHGEQLVDVWKDKLDQNYEHGKLLLQTQTNIGHLLMSEKATKALRSLEIEIAKANSKSDFVAEISSIRVATEDCLFKLIPYAKSDLGVHKYRFAKKK